MQRTILHADMDAFYASVEQRDDPGLQGLPVVVGGGAPRGVVAAASYEARKFGVHSAMPTARALRLCPDLVVLRGNFEVYNSVSAQVFEILRGFSPLVEPLSLDEAFVDISGTERLHGPPLEVARAIKQRVRQQLDLVVSVGVGPSKFVAKIASDLEKPDGLVLVQPNEVRSFLHPLPVSRIFGVGPVAQKKLNELGILTIGELAEYPADELEGRFGDLGRHVYKLAQGDDQRTVVVSRQEKTVGHENTFATDIEDLEELSRIVQEQADRVAARLRKHALAAKIVVLKAKTADFKLRTRRRTLPRHTSDGGRIGRAAIQLLSKLVRGGIGPLRLTGVSTAGLVEQAAPRQLTIDEPVHQKEQTLGRTLDRINAKFGRGALKRGTQIKRPEQDQDESS